MFTQTENPLGELIPSYHSPLILESTYSNSPSNIWKWILAFYILIVGIIFFLFWSERNKENKPELDDKNKPLVTPNFDGII